MRSANSLSDGTLYISHAFYIVGRARHKRCFKSNIALFLSNMHLCQFYLLLYTLPHIIPIITSLYTSTQDSRNNELRKELVNHIAQVELPKIALDTAEARVIRKLIRNELYMDDLGRTPGGADVWRKARCEMTLTKPMYYTTGIHHFLQLS